MLQEQLEAQGEDSEQVIEGEDGQLEQEDEHGDEPQIHESKEDFQEILRGE